MILVLAKGKNLSKRYIANVLDYAIILLLIAVYIFTFGEKEAYGIYKISGGKVLLIPLLWFLYFPVSETLFCQTLAKRVFNLLVCDVNGTPPSIVQSLLRRCLDPVELVFLGIPSALSINFSSGNQRIGDIIAETSVVNSTSVCRFCDINLELTPREAINEVFMCPNCKQLNA